MVFQYQSLGLEMLIATMLIIVSGFLMHRNRIQLKELVI